MSSLPIESVLPELRQVLQENRCAVLEAPPGAGKTTCVPLALLDAPWLQGQRIIMLEPRRLATRAAALRMADLLGEPVGETVGYRVRMDNKVSARTRIEVVTEGILTRQLQNDPTLEGVGLVIFDEFHERHLQGDLGLALTLDAQAGLRDDLRILVMSATLDGDAVAKLLGNAPQVRSEGRSFPVETRYLSRESAGRIEGEVVSAVIKALREETGNILVFLPGVGEIRRVEERLREEPLDAVDIAPLYGDLTRESQDLAIQPPPAGRRKVVLATAIAETSLTIEGIRVVVDAGLMRVPRFDPRSGMTRLTTLNVSQASADQRRGRAGRLEPGVCYRLWTEGRQKSLAQHTAPEIVEADLAPLALELAMWGVSEATQLQWLTSPPAAAYAQALELLVQLGALDSDKRITSHGQQMAALGAHPRLAHMILRGKELGLGVLAVQLAALLEERDVLKLSMDERDADLRRRIEAVRQVAAKAKLSDRNIDRAACQRVLQVAQRWQRQLKITDNQVDDIHLAGLLLAFAYPDRIAQRRGGDDGRYRLANGRGAFFAHHDLLSNEEFLVAAQLDGVEREARIFLAAAVDKAQLEQHFASQVTEQAFVEWDDREQAVQARRQRRLGTLVLDDEPLTEPDPALITQGLLDGIRRKGLEVLLWNDGLRGWQSRVMLLRRKQGEAAWPDVSDDALLETLEQWLGPFSSGMQRLSHLQRLDLKGCLYSLLDWPQQQALETLAPTHITVPSGSRIRIDYSNSERPVLAVRLQEMFGLQETPSIVGGAVPLMLHLLSPAQRPVQVTADLAGFWSGSYHEVKKELKGRYPKHYWPDDPLVAEATSRTKPRR